MSNINVIIITEGTEAVFQEKQQKILFKNKKRYQATEVYHSGNHMQNKLKIHTHTPCHNMEKPLLTKDKGKIIKGQKQTLWFTNNYLPRSNMKIHS